MRFCFSLMLCFVCLPFFGCGGPKYVPVTGTLTVDGEFVDGVTLSFFPESGGTNASASTSPMGAFSVRTADQEGCIPGKYTVTVIKLVQQNTKPAAPSAGPPLNVPPPVNILPEKYAAKDTSGLSVAVEPGMKPLELAITSK
jgi:hypothetical protein